MPGPQHVSLVSYTHMRRRDGMSADAVHNENAWNFGLQQQCDGMMRTHHQVCFVRNFRASQHCLRLLKRELEVPSWAGTKSRNTSTLLPLAFITRAIKDRCFAILLSVGSATRRENLCLCKSSQISLVAALQEHSL